MSRNFMELLESRQKDGKFVCVGLDPDMKKIPESVQAGSDNMTILRFNTEIVMATADLVVAFKPNFWFYFDYGLPGLWALQRTIRYIHDTFPDVPVILDVKMGDIGHTTAAAARGAFDQFGADAVTVSPYLGEAALRPLLAYTDKGVFVLSRTSNPGADEFQDDGEADDPLYVRVARRVARNWNSSGNCGLVVGATAPRELLSVREEIGDLQILIPGVGAQQGDLRQSVLNGKDSNGRGFIVNSSRGVIYASKDGDYAQAAAAEVRRLNKEIVSYL